MKGFEYVLMTPAKNEEAFIEKTLQSVVRQTVPPQKWVVISDGSTDRTDEIIQAYARSHPFIQYVRKDDDREHNFTSKVNAIHRALREFEGCEYQFIGNLDADMTLEPDYYETVLRKFNEDPLLGIAGGKVIENINGKLVTYDHSDDSVAGAVQMFRRDCFETIGGYLPLRMGGEDAAAEIHARMLGWKVRKFTDLEVIENRETGYQNKNLLRTKYRQGVIFHTLGYHPLFHVVKCIRRITDRPFLVGSLFLFWGYFSMLLKKRKALLSEDIVSYVRREQVNKMKELMSIRS